MPDKKKTTIANFIGGQTSSARSSFDTSSNESLITVERLLNQVPDETRVAKRRGGVQNDEARNNVDFSRLANFQLQVLPHGPTYGRWARLNFIPNTFPSGIPPVNQTSLPFGKTSSEDYSLSQEPSIPGTGAYLNSANVPSILERALRLNEFDLREGVNFNTFYGGNIPFRESSARIFTVGDVTYVTDNGWFFTYLNGVFSRVSFGTRHENMLVEFTGEDRALDLGQDAITALRDSYIGVPNITFEDYPAEDIDLVQKSRLPNQAFLNVSLTRIQEERDRTILFFNDAEPLAISALRDSGIISLKQTKGEDFSSSVTESERIRVSAPLRRVSRGSVGIKCIDRNITSSSGTGVFELPQALQDREVIFKVLDRDGDTISLYLQPTKRRSFADREEYSLALNNTPDTLQTSETPLITEPTLGAERRTALQGGGQVSAGRLNALAAEGFDLLLTAPFLASQTISNRAVGSRRYYFYSRSNLLSRVLASLNAVPNSVSDRQRVSHTYTFITESAVASGANVPLSELTSVFTEGVRCAYKVVSSNPNKRNLRAFFSRGADTINGSSLNELLTLSSGVIMADGLSVTTLPQRFRVGTGDNTLHFNLPPAEVWVSDVETDQGDIDVPINGGNFLGTTVLNSQRRVFIEDAVRGGFVSESFLETGQAALGYAAEISLRKDEDIISIVGDRNFFALTTGGVMSLGTIDNLLTDRVAEFAGTIASHLAQPFIYLFTPTEIYRVNYDRGFNGFRPQLVSDRDIDVLKKRIRSVAGSYNYILMTMEDGSIKGARVNYRDGSLSFFDLQFKDLHAVVSIEGLLSGGFRIEFSSAREGNYFGILDLDSTTYKDYTGQEALENFTSRVVLNTPAPYGKDTGSAMMNVVYKEALLMFEQYRDLKVNGKLLMAAKPTVTNQDFVPVQGVVRANLVAQAASRTATLEIEAVEDSPLTIANACLEYTASMGGGIR